MTPDNWLRAIEQAGAKLTDAGHRAVGRNPAAMRQVCAYCKKVIRDGALTAGGKESHGMCSPPCPEAKAMGWGQ